MSTLGVGRGSFDERGVGFTFGHRLFPSSTLITPSFPHLLPSFGVVAMTGFAVESILAGCSNLTLANGSKWRLGLLVNFGFSAGRELEECLCSLLGMLWWCSKD